MLAAVLIFWALGAYNRLVRLRSDVMRHQLSVAQLWQRHGLILREEIRGMAQVRDTESQWAMIAGEDTQWQTVVQSVRQIEAVLARVLTQPSRWASVDDLAALRAAQEVLGQSWKRLAASSEDLAGQPIPDKLNRLWQSHVQQTEQQVRAYNHAVEIYHDAINAFPALVLAGVFGFAPSAQL